MTPLFPYGYRGGDAGGCIPSPYFYPLASSLSHFYPPSASLFWVYKNKKRELTSIPLWGKAYTPTPP